MKKLSVLYLLICFSFYQGQLIPTILKNNNYMSLINKDFEKLDFSKLKKALNQPTRPNSNVLYETIYDTLKNGDVTEFSDSYNRIYIKKGWFNIYKEFYSNGNIKLKRIENKTSNDSYGMQYKFDENGKLSNTTNFEEGWKTSFVSITEIAEKYAKKYNYKTDTALDGIILGRDKQSWDKEYVKIWRQEKDGKRYWLIGFNKGHYNNPDNKKCERLIILVDDITGKVIEKDHYFDAYNRFFKNLDNLLGLSDNY